MVRLHKLNPQMNQKKKSIFMPQYRESPFYHFLSIIRKSSFSRQTIWST